jgi:hypothetical protein
MEESEQDQLRETILLLLDKRDVGKTICPSEASRAVFGARRGNEREFMERTRTVAATLAAEGMVEVCQKGQVVDIATAKGPIRLRKKT